MNYSSITKLESIGIPFLPQLLEERFGLLYWRGGNPVRKLPKTLGELARDLRIAEDEVSLRLRNLKSETEDILLDQDGFKQVRGDDEILLLDVRPENERVNSGVSAPETAIPMSSAYFMDILPKLKAAPKVVTLSANGGRAVSAALYLRSLGVSAFSLEGGLKRLKA